MSIVRFRQLRVAALSLLVLTALIVPNSTAYACWGSTCRGLDPVDQGCSGHTANYETWYLAGTGTIKVEARHSDNCRSFWTRVSRVEGGYKYMLGYIYEVGTSYHYYYPISGASWYTSMLYTDMVSGTSSVEAFAEGWMRNTYFGSPSDNYLHAWCYAYGH